MSALGTMDDLDGWLNNDEVPLVRNMFALATCIVRRIVVRRPVAVFDAELIHQGEGGPVHEVVARTGILLRGPVTLMRGPRPAAPRAASEPAGERLRRA